MPLFTYFSLVLTMLLWGGTFIAGRLLAESVEPASAAFLRFLIASAAMLMVTRLVEKKLILPPKKCGYRSCLLGMTGVFAYNVFFFSGLQHINAGRASLIIACTPLVITIFAAIFLRERLTALKALWRSPVSYRSHNGHQQRSSRLTSHRRLWSWGTGFGRMRSQLVRLLAHRQICSRTLSPLTAVCYSSIIGTFLLSIPAAREGLFGRLSTITTLDWASLAYLGICGTALGFLFIIRELKKLAHQEPVYLSTSSPCFPSFSPGSFWVNQLNPSFWQVVFWCLLA